MEVTGLELNRRAPKVKQQGTPGDWRCSVRKGVEALGQQSANRDLDEVEHGNSRTAEQVPSGMQMRCPTPMLKSHHMQRSEFQNCVWDGGLPTDKGGVR